MNSTTTASVASTRNPALDILRAAALVRVVLWHSSGNHALTWIAAIPVMFFVTGFLLAQAFETRSAMSVVVSRLRRLVLPLWLLGAVVTALTLASKKLGLSGTVSLEYLWWLFPLHTPPGPAWAQGWITSPLWYLRTLLQITLLAPVLYIAAKKVPRTSLLVLASLVIVGELGLQHRLWAVQDLVTFSLFALLGMAAHHRRAASSSWLASSLFAAVGLVVWLNFSPISSGVINDSHTAHTLLGVLYVGVANAYMPRIASWYSNKTVRRVTDALTRRSLTIYLWHSGFLGISYLVIGRFFSHKSALLFVCVTLLGSLLTALAVSVVGPLEGWSAKKTPLRSPSSRKRSLYVVRKATVFASLAAFGAIAVVASGTSKTELLPPVPSQGPADVILASGDTESLFFAAHGNSESVLSALGVTPAKSDPKPPQRQRLADRIPTTTVKQPPSTVQAVVPGSSAPAFEASAPEFSTPTALTLNDVATSWVEKNNYPGVSIAVVAPGRGRWLFSRGTGAGGAPLTTETELPMQSNTKSFTAAILLQAVADGLITLDTPVGVPTRFPWFTVAKDVKLKDLLGHRSGLLNYADTAEHKADWTKIDSPGSALQAVQNAGLQFAPGSGESYSSSNYIVAGLLAEQIYGSPIEQLITERILNRLSLQDSRVQAPSPGAPGTGTGNMYSTITDMARWTQAHWRDSRLLSPPAQRLAMTFPKNSMLGYGTWGFCPCKKLKGSLTPAAVGSNGGESLLRYYAATDTVVVVYLPGGIWTDGRTAQAEELVTNLLLASKP